MINKRKKSVRLRGSKTHGYGSKKKHRGSGNRGGKGNAGSGKRADTKKPSLWGHKYFGKHGFKSKRIKTINPINIDYLEENIEKLRLKNLATKENDIFHIDLEKLGFDKLLGTGKVLNKYKIKISHASKRAVEKIKNSGGELTLTIKEKD